MGGNFSVRRRFALTLGGFDEQFVGAAYRFEADFIDPYSTPVYLGVSTCVAGAPGDSIGLGDSMGGVADIERPLAMARISLAKLAMLA